MVSTLVTSTVLNYISPAVVAGALGGIAIVVLLLLLAARELSYAEVVRGRASERLETFSRYVLIPLVPFLLVFVVIVALRALEAL